MIVLSANDVNSKSPVESAYYARSVVQKNGLYLMSQYARFTKRRLKMFIMMFDLYWEGTMEKLIIWTGGQRRLSYRYTLGNLEIAH